MSLIPPSVFLALTLAIALAAVAINAFHRGRHRRVLRDLATRWGMHYSVGDRFSLTGRMAGAFPVTGAADILAMDLIYGTETDYYRYLLTAEYTTGILHSKKRRQRACTLREPKTPGVGQTLSPVVFAPEELSLIEQYEWLHEREIARRGETSTA